MPVFIAKRYDGKIESIILAKNYSLANAYWQGKGIIAHSIIEKSEKDLIDHPTGILPLMNTKEKEIYKDGKFIKFLVIGK